MAEIKHGGADRMIECSAVAMMLSQTWNVPAGIRCPERKTDKHSGS
jgi:hypothetical protein